MTHDQCEPATKALAGLLNEFRHGNIVALSAEEKGMERHLGSLSVRWNDRFPGFPDDDFPYASLRGVLHRKHRDAYLKTSSSNRSPIMAGRRLSSTPPACSDDTRATLPRDYRTSGLSPRTSTRGAFRCTGS